MECGRRLDQALVGNEQWVSDTLPLLQDALLVPATPPQPVAPSMLPRPAGPDVVVCYCSGGPKSRGHAARCPAATMHDAKLPGS